MERETPHPEILFPFSPSAREPTVRRSCAGEDSQQMRSCGIGDANHAGDEGRLHGRESRSSVPPTHAQVSIGDYAGNNTVGSRYSMDPFTESMIQDGVQRTGQFNTFSVDEHVAPPRYDEPSLHTFSPGSNVCINDDASSQAMAKRKKKAARKTDRMLWNPEEDELLVSAWLNISQDPIVGKNQQYSTYWDRILEYYNMHRKPTSMARPIRGAINRWQSISADGSKFAGYMKKVNDLHPSGTTSEDRIAMAMKMFKEIEKKNFPFLHVWPLLSEHPKWLSFLATKKQKADGASNDEPIEVDSPVGTELPRPIGRETAKKARSRSASSSGTMSTGAYAEHWAEMNTHKKAMVDLKREQVEMVRNADDERIMLIDLNQLTGRAREYIESRQVEILQRRSNQVGSR